MSWAQVPLRHNVEFGDILIPSLWLVGGLILAAIVLALARRVRQQEARSVDTIHDQLAHFRELYAKGQMSKPEYDRVHALLVARLRESEQIAPDESELPESRPEEGPASSSDEPSPDRSS